MAVAWQEVGPEISAGSCFLFPPWFYSTWQLWQSIWVFGSEYPYMPILGQIMGSDPKKCGGDSFWVVRQDMGKLLEIL